jgi:calcineurin-like phosphoesterase family protein
MPEYFFTADEHYFHDKIRAYCARPFASVEEMNDTLIANFNAVVSKQDVTIHAGDFAFGHTNDINKIIAQLNGNHIFLKGSHDRWMQNSAKFMWRGTVKGQFIVACHYALRTWERAHYGSWQVYGHSHGNLPPIGKQWDVGVDNNDFKPVSFEQLQKIMEKQPMRHNIKHDTPVEENREIE